MKLSYRAVTLALYPSLGLHEVPLARVRRHVQRQVVLSLVAPVSPLFVPVVSVRGMTTQQHTNMRYQNLSFKNILFYFYTKRISSNYALYLFQLKF